MKAYKSKNIRPGEDPWNTKKQHWKIYVLSEQHYSFKEGLALSKHAPRIYGTGLFWIKDESAYVIKYLENNKTNAEDLLFVIYSGIQSIYEKDIFKVMRLMSEHFPDCPQKTLLNFFEVVNNTRKAQCNVG